MSSQANFYSEGLHLSNLWFAPEEVARNTTCISTQYAKTPILARIVAVPLGAIAGAVKPLLFPIMSLIGVVVMPIIAAVRYALGKDDAVPWLQAWNFSILGLVGTCAFCIVSAYYLPLVASAGIFLGAVSISITIHVYRAVKAPPLKPLKTPILKPS